MKGNKFDIFLIVVILIFAGVCYSVINSIDVAHESGISKSGDYEFKRVCIDGVEYFFKDSRRGYLAPHFKSDGSLYLCE